MNLLAQPLSRRLLRADGLTSSAASMALLSPGVLTQSVQGVSLARRAADLVVADVLPAFGDLPAFFQAGLGVVALAQQGGQGVIEHFAQRVVVIAGRPLAQLVELVGHHRLVVEHRLHGLEFRVIAGAWPWTRPIRVRRPKGTLTRLPRGGTTVPCSA